MRNKIKWTEDAISKEALKYKTRGAFKLGNGTAYTKARKTGILSKVCSHMEPPRIRKYTYEQLKEFSSGYSSVSLFRKENPGPYQTIHSRGLQDELFSHMKRVIAKPYTKKKCQTMALKCKTRSEFQKRMSGTYTCAQRNGWLDDICKHMPEVKRWTFESAHKEALKYSTKIQFDKGSPGGYSYALKNGIIDDICGHMKPVRENWDIEKLKEITSNCSSYSEFYNNIPAYGAAFRLGVLDEITRHLPKKYIRERTFREIEDLTKGYKTLREFRTYEEPAYQYAYRRGWMDAFKHLKRNDASDLDVVYIWRCDREFYNGNPIYKIGVTSDRLGLKRIYEVAKFGNKIPKDVVLLKKVKALETERLLLKYGDDPKFTYFSGSTEFRSLSAEEYGACRFLMEYATL